ncbi:MAG: hypothetical protein KAF91_24070 [Nostoc sp. TH1S01]|nr:hypothetical protein [Nostoc sp. TH1S01]
MKNSILWSKYEQTRAMLIKATTEVLTNAGLTTATTMNLLIQHSSSG